MGALGKFAKKQEKREEKLGTDRRKWLMKIEIERVRWSFVKCPKAFTRIRAVIHRFNIVERRKLMKSISPKNDDKSVSIL